MGMSVPEIFPYLCPVISAKEHAFIGFETGQSATILKVLGHGGFRRRIMEMGFVRGKKVEVVLNAPLRDPIVYKIMDYEVSLRRSEAHMVVVITNEEAEG